MSISSEAIEAATDAMQQFALIEDRDGLQSWQAYAKLALEAAAPHMLAGANAEITKLRAHILDIDAHATPFGDIPDDPGYVGMYLVSAGSLHRALGKIGHTAPSCEAEAALRKLGLTHDR